MKAEDRELYANVQQMNMYLKGLEQQLEETNAREVSLHALADTLYALRETYETLDEMRKRIDKLRTRYSKQYAVIHVAKGDHTFVAKTDYCSATPKVKATMSVPKKDKDPVEWKALMDWLQIPERARATEAVRVHYPGLQALVSQAMQDCERIPQDLLSRIKTDDIEVSIRKKKGVMDD